MTFKFYSRVSRAQRGSEIAERFRRWKAWEIRTRCEVCDFTVGYEMGSRHEMRSWTKLCRADALGHHRKTEHPVSVHRTFARKIASGVAK